MDRVNQEARHGTMLESFGLWIGFCRSTDARHDTMLNIRFVDDYVLSIRGCKARHYASNIFMNADRLSGCDVESVQ